MVPSKGGGLPSGELGLTIGLPGVERVANTERKGKMHAAFMMLVNCGRAKLYSSISHGLVKCSAHQLSIPDDPGPARNGRYYSRLVKEGS